MRDKWLNNVNIQGYIFNHNLQQKVSQKGMNFISGDIQVATDEEGLNVVPIYVTYVPEKKNDGSAHGVYPTLQKIMECDKTFEAVGAEAQKIRVSGSAEVRTFWNREGEQIEFKRVRGSFFHLMAANEKFADNRSNFQMDMIIAGCAEKEVEDGDDYVELRGYVFDFFKNILPITVSVSGKAAMKYFIDQDISNANPLVTELRGDIKSNIIRREITEEGAFGEPEVRVTTRTIHAWDVTWAAKEPMEWDDESTITKDELKKKLQEREEQLAEDKKRQEEYQASQNGRSGFPAEKKEDKKASKDDSFDFPF